jgi:3-dehydroquinate dehydratase II
MKIFVLNGPNLNLLGRRELDIYGTTTLADVEKMCRERAETLGAEVDFRQTNHEGELVDWLQEARTGADGVILNGAALTHYSQALRDGITACEVPVVEVHITNIFAREPFRANSVISPVAVGIISGLGVQGYVLAVEALVARLGGS